MFEKIKNFLRKKFCHPVDIEKTWVEEPAQFCDLISYLNWFDKTASLEDTKQRAESDWKKLISNFPEYSSLTKDSCLEIGFGGGRLSVPASRDFKKVYGVDIHNSFARTMEYLALYDVHNCGLLRREELKKIPDASLDFIFSFIVFQHFNSFTGIDHYLWEIKRLLKPSGYCHIFYAKTAEDEVIEVDPRLFKKRRCSLFVNTRIFSQALG